MYKRMLVLGLAAACGGCAVAKVSQPAFTATAQRGYYDNAARLARGEIGRYNTPEDLLWNLQLGTMERLLGRYRESNAIFDKAEDAYRTYDLRSLLAKSYDTSKAYVFNDSALPYTGRHYERVMMNTYKALNFAALGDAANARVEFNRALVRQDEAKAFYIAEAAELEAERARRRQVGTEQDRAVEATMNSAELKSIIDEHYKNLDAYKAYDTFVNPYTNFAAGLFFWLEGDDKAADILKEAHALADNNDTVAAALARAIKGDAPSGELWVLFENGTAPERRETRIDIPLFLVRSDVKYVGAAFVDITEGAAAFDTVTVKPDNGAAVTTEAFADMAGVVVQEFRKELPLTTFREVSRAVFKTAFQYQMNAKYGFWAGLAGAVYQATTTAVDVRSWSTLPYNIQTAHFRLNGARALTVTAGDFEPQTISLNPEAENMILYVRALSGSVAPVVEVIEFR